MLIFLSFFRIIDLCQQIPKGITDAAIQNDMPQFDTQQRVMAINRLLSTVSVLFLEINLSNKLWAWMTQLSTGLTKHLSSLQTTSWEAKLIQPLEIQHLHNANSKMAFPKDLSFHLQSSTYILLTCLLLPNAHKSYADNITITATQCDIQTTKAHIQAYLHTTQYTYSQHTKL